MEKTKAKKVKKVKAAVKADKAAVKADKPADTSPVWAYVRANNKFPTCSFRHVGGELKSLVKGSKVNAFDLEFFTKTLASEVFTGAFVEHMAKNGQTLCVSDAYKGLVCLVPKRFSGIKQTVGVNGMSLLVINKNECFDYMALIKALRDNDVPVQAIKAYGHARLTETTVPNIVKAFNAFFGMKQ